MGYSQYYYKKELVHDQDTWDTFLKDVLKVACRFKLKIPNSIQFIKGEELYIVGDIDVPIVDGLGEGKPPEFNSDIIRFNGLGEDSHETLSIRRDDSYILKKGDDDLSQRMIAFYRERWEKDGVHFNFCKTNHKPYELLVIATLILYQHHFGDTVEVSGDGGAEGFQDGLDLVNETLGYKIVMEDILTPEED